jgi:hypothetical protein
MENNEIVTFKVTMYVKRTGRIIDIPSDVNLSFNEALYRKRLYEKRNKDCIYEVVEMAS